MIRPGESGAAVYVCVDPVDFRKQSASLAALVQTQLELNPFDEALYVFTNRRRNSVKILAWEVNGFVLWTKKLERERFHWPKGEGLVDLSVQQLNWLLDGYNLAKWQPHQALNYQFAA